MTRIPSTEKTEDFIYRFEIKKGTPLYNSDEPNLLVLEDFVGPAGVFHSLDVTVLKDGQRANDIEFRSFEHVCQPNMTYVKFKFYDMTQNTMEHDFLLTIVLRYLHKS
jgi:hypothetical protein